MTQQEETGLETAVEETPPAYRIDEGWYERNRRSLDDMIAARTGGTTGAKRRRKAVPSMADLAKIEGFVNPNLPVREAVFRLLLVYQNKPLDVEQLSQYLTDCGIGIMDARLIQPKALQRILDSDDYYGITRVEA